MSKKTRPRERKLTRQQQKLWETFIFLSKVLLLSLPLYFIILFNIPLTSLQMFDASVSSGIFTTLGYQVNQEGAFMTVVSEKPFSFYLNEDCTAWKSILFLFALIFAVPAISLKSRLAGFVLGIPVLWLGNQARILGVVLTERATNVQFAMFTHDYFWRVFLVFLVLGLWLSWLKYPSLYEKPFSTTAKKPRKPKAHPRLISRKNKK